MSARAAPVALPPTHFTPAKAVVECMQCTAPFTFTRRRHNCRICGRVFCDNCSRGRVELNESSSTKVRACDECAQRWTLAKKNPQLQPNAALGVSTSDTDNNRLRSSSFSSSARHSHHSRQSSGEATPTIPTQLSASQSASVVSSVDFLQQSQQLPIGTEGRQPSAPGAPKNVTSTSNLIPKSSSFTSDVIISPSSSPEKPSHGSSHSVTFSKDQLNQTTQKNVSSIAGNLSSQGNVNTEFLDQTLGIQNSISEDYLFSPSPPISPFPSPPIPDTVTKQGRSPSLPVSISVPSLASSPPGSSAQSSQAKEREHAFQLSNAVRMNLPLQICLVILNSTFEQMKTRYEQYLQTKETRKEEDPLSFQHFIFFHTIRDFNEKNKNDNFLFSKAELAHCMMREEGNSLAKKENFLRYAPILPPLASRLDAPSVYNILSEVHGSEGVGISVHRFTQYVDQLKKESKIEDQWPEFRDAFSFSKREQLMVIRTGVTDTTHFPPMIGRIGICSSHLIFESMFKKRRAIKWSDIYHIDKLDTGFLRKTEHGMKISCREAIVTEEDDKKKEKGKEKDDKDTASISDSAPTQYRDSVLHWDLPGFSHETSLERSRTLILLQIMHTSHIISDRLIANSPSVGNIPLDITPSSPDPSGPAIQLPIDLRARLVAAALLQEIFMTVRRMKALEGLPNADPILLNPYGTFSEEDKARFVTEVREEVLRKERIKSSKSTWLTKMLPGLAGEGKRKGSVNRIADIDPEASVEYKTLEELNGGQLPQHESFSVKTLAYNVKLFRSLIEPFLAFISLMKRLRRWENPLSTIFVIALLLNMCYRNYVCYLPAIIILLNTCLVLIEKIHPDVIQWILYEEEVRQFNEEPHYNSDGTVDTSSAPVMYAVMSGTGQPVVISPETVVHKKKELSNGLFARLKQYRNVALKTKDHLESVQNGLLDINIKLMKLHGLYSWRTPDSTRRFLKILTVVFIALVFIPFRFIFPFIIIDWFTTKWQRDGSMMERLLESVELPEKIALD